MNYEQFLQYVKENIATKLEDGEKCNIFIKKLSKNNGQYVDSLHIYQKGSNVSPSIELNVFYERYKDGEDKEKLLEHMAQIYKNSMPCPFFLPKSLEHFSAVSGSIIMRLINYEKNKEMLEQCPHRRLLDLAMTYRWLAHKDDVGISTALITNEELAFWQKSEEDLYRLAMKNTPQLFPATIRTMKEVLREHIDIEEDEPDIYVLTNEMGIHGANCILYDKILDNFARQMKRDFLILPSSIHEVLFVPVASYLKKEDLYELVNHANTCVVAQQEVLSDSVYIYDYEKHNLSIL